jgi:hypothetical protein
MIDDLDRDAAGGGFVEGAGGVAMERFPGFCVDLGFEGGFERRVGIVGAQEICVADEEALFVVVGIDEPTGDATGAIAAHRRSRDIIRVIVPSNIVDSLF